MDNSNVLLDTVYEATDGDYAVIVFPASQVPEDVLEKMDKINRIYLPDSHKDVIMEKFGETERVYLPDSYNSEYVPKDISMGNNDIGTENELSRISHNYADAMIKMIDMKAEIEKEMVYCTAAYARVMCEIIENKGI